MRNLLVLISLAAIALSLGGCGALTGMMKKAVPPGAGQGKPPKPPVVLIPVEVSQPERRDMSAFLKTSANVEAEQQVDVVAEGLGQCLKVFVEEGDAVTRGQVLAELEKDDIEATVRQSRVSLQQQKLTLSRSAKLHADGLLSDQDYDAARFNVEQAEATLEAQEVQLANRTIHAPIAGIVTRRSIQQGMLVSSGTPAFTVVDPDSYVLPIYLWEGVLHRIAVGQEATVTADSLPDETFTATVRRINPGVEQGGKVKVVLEFDEATRARMRHGLYARVRLVTDVRENALVVPKDAIVEENARRYLMLVEEKPEEEEQEAEEQAEEQIKEEPAAVAQADTAATEEDAAPSGDGESADDENEPEGPALIAVRVEVETGLEDPEYIEILEGIDEDSRVITLGQHMVRQGARVKVTTREAEIEANISVTPEEAIAEREAKEAAKRQAKGGAKPDQPKTEAE